MPLGWMKTCWKDREARQFVCFVLFLSNFVGVGSFGRDVSGVRVDIKEPEDGVGLGYMM